MSRRSALWGGWALAALLAAGGYATWRLTRGMNGLGVTSVVLISIDTLRADRLGCYGGDPRLAPNIDRLAAEGARFERCLTTAPITLPAHASLLSGTDPIAHGARLNGASMFDPRNPSLAAVLRDQGFVTAACVSAWVLDQRYGLDLGFDEYDDRTVDEQGESDPSPLERRGERTVAAALRFVERTAAAPFFLWVHLFDPHAPYQAPAPFGERLLTPYDAEVAYADWCVGKLLEGLEERGRLADALVVLTADHGEGLGDHGESTHSVFVYDSTLRVPLVFWSKGRIPAGTVETDTTSIISVAPTILDLLRLERPAGMYGPSLASAVLRGQSGDEEYSLAGGHACFESLAGEFYYGFAPLSGIDRGGNKLIVAPRPELYRVAEDRDERANLFDQESGLARELRSLLDQDMRAHVTGRSAPRTLDPDTIERLRQQGYLASRAASTSGGGRDPKDGVHIVEALQQATLAAKDERAAAIAAVERLVLQEPEVAEAFDILGGLRFEEGDRPGALRAFGRALELNPGNPDLHTQRGTVLLHLDRDAEAEESLEAALELDPTHVRARVQLGLLLLKSGRLDAARRAFDEVLQQHADVVAARIGRADCVTQMNNVRLADQDLRAALEQEPKNLGVLTRLARTSVLLENQEEALFFFLRAQALDPSVLPPPGLLLPETP